MAAIWTRTSGMSRLARESARHEISLALSCYLPFFHSLFTAIHPYGVLKAFFHVLSNNCVFHPHNLVQKGKTTFQSKFVKWVNNGQHCSPRTPQPLPPVPTITLFNLHCTLLSTCNTVCVCVCVCECVVMWSPLTLVLKIKIAMEDFNNMGDYLCQHTHTCTHMATKLGMTCYTLCTTALWSCLLSYVLIFYKSDQPEYLTTGCLWFPHGHTTKVDRATHKVTSSHEKMIPSTRYRHTVAHHTDLITIDTSPRKVPSTACKHCIYIYI